MAEGGAEDPEVLEELADRFFPLPQGPLLYWPKAKAREGEGLLAKAATPKELPGPTEEVRVREGQK